MFYFVGLGLFDEKDISLKGLECLKKADKIYAEFFTSKLFGSSLQSIENLIGKPIEILTREEVEQEKKFIDESKNNNIALITGGDPLIATTHTEFLIECAQKNISYEIIHASSILSSAPAISGLQAYKFGKVTTIPFPDHNFYPKSPYYAIEENLKNNMHTLILLDIQSHNDRYMTVNEGLKYLMNIKNQLGNKGTIDEDTLAIGIARVGSKEGIIKAGPIKELINFNFGNPLHCIIIPSKLHIIEAEYLVEIAGADFNVLKEILE